MKNFHCLIKNQLLSHSKNVALQIGSSFWTYQQLDACIARACRYLIDRGVEQGSLVSIVATHDPNFIFLLFALLRLGAMINPINYRLQTNQQLTLVKKIHAQYYLRPSIINLSLFRPSHHEVDATPLLPAFYLYTSGSSGEAKIAALSPANFYYNSLGVIPALRLEREDKYLASLPFHHVGGLAIIFRSFIAGATLVLPQTTVDLEIIRGKITHLSLVPTQLYRLLQSTHIDNNLKCVLLGGAHCEKHLISEANTRQIPIYKSYGMTEMASSISIGQEASGKILPHREMMLANDGEILVRGQTLFSGYIQDGKLHLPLKKGWFPTGDLGKINISGSLEIHGRKDRLFICGGENIHPEEIEKALLHTCSDICSAFVVPIPDKEYGHRPFAFVQSNTPFKEDTIKQKLKMLLPSIKIPISIIPLPERQSLKPSYAELMNIALRKSGIGTP